METDKLTAIGKELGLSGPGLKQWIDEERVREREAREVRLAERNAAKEADAEALARLQAEKEVLELRLKLRELDATTGSGACLRDSERLTVLAWQDLGRGLLLSENPHLRARFQIVHRRRDERRKVLAWRGRALSGYRLPSDGSFTRPLTPAAATSFPHRTSTRRRLRHHRDATSPQPPGPQAPPLSFGSVLWSRSDSRLNGTARERIPRRLLLPVVLSPLTASSASSVSLRSEVAVDAAAEKRAAEPAGLLHRRRPPAAVHNAFGDRRGPPAGVAARARRGLTPSSLRWYATTPRGCRITMGKLKAFDIVLDGYRSVYHPGQAVRGKCVLELKGDMRLKAVRVFMRGLAKVHWTESRSTGNRLGAYTEHYNAEMEYFFQGTDTFRLR
ncbi:hypothetical protein HPB51_023846 [Rhipicephalus microplus]|uniref:Arrestin-like N-terminal domain-containing protein n=1 Tax=Rhipicephalus microplus TaxID=6941 RepID=A0A9J6F813_RHIMP|nr:hypothetical protein HPB51_023846 [Rhipicephalus microplus]